MAVSPEKEEALRNRFRELNIFETDIEEKFIRSGGKGGQNVNKVATCVYLKHLPTRIEIKMQQARSQGLNRFLARQLLANKIEEQILGAKSKQQQQFEKIRRQKRKRSRRAKEKMLQNKKIQANKKTLRKRPVL